MTTPSIRMEPNGPLAKKPYREAKQRRVDFVSRPSFLREEQEGR